MVTNNLYLGNKYAAWTTYIHIYFFLPLSHEVGSVQHVFYHVVIKIHRQHFYFRQLVCCQPALKLEWVLTIANVAGTNSLTCLPKHGGARDNNFGYPSDDWPLRTLLSFHDDDRPSRSSYIHTHLMLYPRGGSKGISDIYYFLILLNVYVW
jgi:hypothetical protein